MLQGSVCVCECMNVFVYNLYMIYKKAFSLICTVRLCGWMGFFFFLENGSLNKQE